ncbi:MAG: hypothetical protein GY696_26690 [Gammaproteobacteria bacterium]|nr:hypothetical protein [Gammaproteobacteria bacterium]
MGQMADTEKTFRPERDRRGAQQVQTLAGNGPQQSYSTTIARFFKSSANLKSSG